jgi:mRNA interferase MazF
VRRGDLVTVTIPGDYGKPRPALVIQADQFAEAGSVTVVFLTGTLIAAPLLRLTVEPSPENGLRKRSQIMVDKIMTVRRERVGEPFGRLDDETMLALNRSIALFLGLA